MMILFFDLKQTSISKFALRNGLGDAIRTFSGRVMFYILVRSVRG